MMKEKLKEKLLETGNKIVAILLIVVQLALAVPVFALGSAGALFGAREQSLPHLERYLDMAALERGQKAWQELADEGLAAAMHEWENAALALFQTAPSQQERDAIENERKNATGSFKLIIAERYAKWLSERSYENAENSANSKARLAAELKEKAASWYYTNSASVSTRVIQREDTANAAAAWQKEIADEIILKYLDEWDAQNLGEFDKNHRNRITAEYRRIAKMQENALLHSLLYDTKSLKKEKEDEAAKAIAELLAKEAKEITDADSKSLFDSLDDKIESVDANRQLTQSELDSWLEEFRITFQKGLSQWENAEREFLASRARWESEAAEVYVDSEQTWADAYSKLRGERSAWERSIQQQLDDGKNQWAAESEALSRMLEKASADFESAAQKERNNLEQNIDLQIALYTQSREMLQSAFEGLNYWYDRWAAKFDKVYTNPATAPPPFLQFEKDKKLKATPQNTDIANLLDEISDWKNKYCKFIQDEYALYASQKNKEFDAETAAIQKKINSLKSTALYLQNNNREIAQLQQKLFTDIPAKRQKLVQGANQLAALSGKMNVAEIANILETVKAQSGFCENRIQDDRDPLERVWNASEEAASWLIMIKKYTKSAENALQEMFALSGNIFSSAASWEYFDELDVELLKAKAVARYWKTEENIALAVDRYAQNVTSGIDASDETRKNVDAAKKAYDDCLAQYQAEISALDALYAQIGGKNGKIQIARSALEDAKSKAEQAREKYVLAVIAEKQLDDTPLRKKIYEAIVKMNAFYKETETAADFAAAHNSAALKLAQAEYEKSCNDALFAIINGDGAEEKSLTALRNLVAQAHEKQLSAIPAEYASLHAMLDKISALPVALQEKYSNKIWSIIEQYWQNKVDERENALRYITTGENAYENRYAQSPKIETKTEIETEIWLNLQKEIAVDFGYEQAKALCETFLDALKNGGIEALKNSATLLCANGDAATKALVKKILGQNSIFAGTNFAGLDLYLFENECENADLRDAEKSANLITKYSYCAASFLNAQNAKAQTAVSQLFAEREADVMDGESFDSGEFLRFIRELQTAGSGLGFAQQASLEAYISALYEKAAIKIAVQKAAFPDDAANANISASDINGLYGELEMLQSWQNQLSGAGGTAALVKACSSTKFGMDENYVARLAQTASLVLIQNASVEELENCTDSRSVLKIIEHSEFKDASLDMKEKIASCVLKYFGQSDFSMLCDAAKPHAQVFTDYLYAYTNASSDMSFATTEFLANPLYAIFLSIQNPAIPSARYAQLENEPDLGADVLYLYLMTIAHNSSISAQNGFAGALDELEKISPEKAALVKSFYEQQAQADAYLKLIHGEIGTYTDDADVRFALQYGTNLVQNAVNKREFERMLKPALSTDDSDILLRMQDDSLKTLRELLGAMTSAKYEEVKIAQNVMRLNAAVAGEKEQSSVDWLKKAKELSIADFGSEFDKNANTLESALLLIHQKSMLHKNALQTESMLDATKISAENIHITDRTGSSAEEKEFAEAYADLQDYFNEQKSSIALIYRYIGSITELRELQKSGGASEKVVAAKAVFDAAETEVTAARDAYSAAVDELNVMCNTYNAQLEKANTAFDAAQEAQILKQTQQAIFDWASSIYLEGFGKNASAKYLSPKEKLTQVQFAKVRADAAVSVLENLTKQKIDAHYEGALSGYEKAYENYYTARAIAYETVREIARKEQEVRDAEYDYNAALLKIIYENKLEQGENESSDSFKARTQKAQVAFDMLNVSFDEETGKYVFSLAYTAVKKVKAVTASSAIGKQETTYTVVKNAETKTTAAQKTQSDIFSDYFSAENGAIFELVDDRENKKSFAAVESLEWFSGIMSRKDSFAYLEDLALAALYLKVAGTSGGHQWLTENDANPNLNNAYGAGDIPLGDKRMHGMDLRGIYHDGRMKILEDAYNKIISKNNSEDLARYILYRDTALSPIDWNAFEMNAVKTKSLDIVQNKIKTAVSNEIVMGIVMHVMAGGFVALSVPCMIYAPVVGATLLAAGILCDTAAVFHAITARDLTDLKNDIAKNQSGIATNQNSLKNTVSNDFAAFRQKAQALKKLQDELTLYRGTVGDDEELEYSAFSKSITAILTGAKGVVSADEWHDYYTKDAFTQSGCKDAKSTSDAIAVLNAFLKEAQDEAFQTAAENKIALKAEQYDALESFTKTVNQSFVIAPNDEAALRENALKAGDVNLSLAARSQASREYDALVAKYSNPDALAELTALLQRDAQIAFKNIAHNGSSWLESESDRKIIAIREKLFDARTDYSRSTEDYMQDLLADAKQQTLFAFDHAVAGERTAKQGESAIAQKQFLSRFYDWNNNMQNVLQNAEAQWSAVEEKINSEFRIWQENFAAEYTARTGEWQKNYNEFLHDKDEWMTEQYVAAATRRLNPPSAKAAESAFAKTDTAELLQKLLASSPKLMENENLFDSTAYVENIIAQSGVRELLAYSASLNSGITGSAGITKRGAMSQNANQAASLLAAEKTLQAISAERKTAAGKIAAERARIQLDYTVLSYKDRLKAENESMKKWETELMQEYGYTVTANSISRNQIVYSTVAENIREKQTVHVYEFFVAPNAPTSANLDQAALSGFNDYEIMLTVASEQQALIDWSTDIFGKADKYGRPEEQDVGEDRKLRDGKLGKHIGYRTVLKDGADIDTKKSKAQNVKNAGAGQMGVIMLDFQWNSIIAGQGYASLGTPAYDKALWDDRNSPVKSPTLRSAVDIAFSIIGTAVGGEAGKHIIGLMDDFFFASLDLSYGYKTEEEVAKALGKAVVSEAASFAGGNLGKTVKASEYLNKAGKVFLQAGIAASVTQAVNTTSGFIDAANFSGGSWDWKKLTDRIYGANAIAGMVTSGISAGLSTGFGYTSDATQKFYGGIANLGIKTASKATEFAIHTAYSLGAGGTVKDAFDNMGGLSLNLVDLGALIDMAGTFGARSNGTAQSALGSLAQKLRGHGLLELNIASSGVTAKIGNGGISVGADLYDFGKRMHDKAQLQHYEKEQSSFDDGAAKSEAAYSAYVYGDWNAENTAARLASGKDTLLFANGEGVAKTTSNDAGGRTITMRNSGNSNNNAIQLQHEAYRDGIVTAANYVETQQAVQAHTRMMLSMLQSGVEFVKDANLMNDLAAYVSAGGNMDAFNKYVDANYDSSGEYWKVLKNGSIFDDGKDGEISFEDGRKTIYTISKGKQGSLEEYLGLEKGTGYQLLGMGNAGFAYDSATKTWTGGGTISADTIKSLIDKGSISAQIFAPNTSPATQGLWQKAGAAFTGAVDYLSNTKPVKAAANAWNNVKDDWAKLWSKEAKKEADKQNDYKNSQEAYDAAYKVAADKKLLGKPYGEGGYVCTSFVKDEITGVGLNADDYIKSLRAADNIKLVTGLLPESKTQPSAGTYVFYKEYANKKEPGGSGHVGIIKINDDGTSLILHNGFAKNGDPGVNVYTRTATSDFNKWFPEGERTSNPVRYKPLKIPR